MGRRRNGVERGGGRDHKEEVKGSGVMIVSVGKCYVFFFFEQKTAYEMLRRLVGSEMCIRDRARTTSPTSSRRGSTAGRSRASWSARSRTCLLYTSDAADDLLCVDLGGRRIIQKKKTHTQPPSRRSSRAQYRPCLFS